MFVQRTKEFNQELEAWNATNDVRARAELEKAELETQFDNLDRSKPLWPTFEEREWLTINRKHKTKAVLVKTDNVTATLRKSDGKMVTIQKEKLDVASRVYIDKAFRDISRYPERLKEWQGKKQDLTERIAAVGERIEGATKAKPTAPTLEEVAKEIAAANARRAAEEVRMKQEEQVAARKADSQRQQANLDRFANRLSAAGIDSAVVESVSLSGEIENYLTITVTNVWHVQAYQLRLQAAQNLWKAWASIASPDDVDKARIKIVDLKGNEVGGSRFLGGSLIWVQND